MERRKLKSKMMQVYEAFQRGDFRIRYLPSGSDTFQNFCENWIGSGSSSNKYEICSVRMSIAPPKDIYNCEDYQKFHHGVAESIGVYPDHGERFRHRPLVEGKKINMGLLKYTEEYGEIETGKKSHSLIDIYTYHDEEAPWTAESYGNEGPVDFSEPIKQKILVREIEIQTLPNFMVDVPLGRKVKIKAIEKSNPNRKKFFGLF
jgi:hypothetical protein